MPETTRRARRAMMAEALMLGGPIAALAQDGDRPGEMKGLGNGARCTIDGRDVSERRPMGLDLEGAILRDIAFDRAGLGIVVSDDATLVDVSFAGADLRGASFVAARLTDVRFEDADPRDAIFEGAILEGTDLQPGLLRNT